MIGCIAEARSEVIVVDPSELEDARWFDRDTVARACRGETVAEELFLPPPMAIGRTLVDDWIAGG
jgi:NAD+ diphosphatase